MLSDPVRRNSSMWKRIIFATAPKTIWEVAVVMLIVGTLTTTYYIIALYSIGAAERSQCHGRIFEITDALARYQREFGHFPPPVTYDESGRPMHSWRIILVRFWCPEKCSGYDFREPWNGPNNRKLALKIPEVFQCPSSSGSGGQTNYLLITGSGAFFSSSQATPSVSDITDLHESTILLVESSDSGINWLEPRDLEVSTMAFDLKHDDRPGISSRHREGPAVAFADFKTCRLRADRINEAVLHDLISSTGGDRIKRSTFIETPGGK